MNDCRRRPLRSGTSFVARRPAMAVERRLALAAVVREGVCALGRGAASARATAAAMFVTSAIALASPAAAVKVKVEIEGLRGPIRDNVQLLLSIAQADDPSPDRARQLHAKAPSEIETALQPFGFYQPRIESSLVEEGDRLVARYVIEPGPLMKLAGVDVQLTGSGASDRGFRRTVQRFPLRRGGPLVHTSYEAGKQE